MDDFKKEGFEMKKHREYKLNIPGFMFPNRFQRWWRKNFPINRPREVIETIAGIYMAFFEVIGFGSAGTMAGMGGAAAFIATALSYLTVGGALFAAQSLLSKPKDQSSMAFSRGGLLIYRQERRGSK